MPWTTRSTIKNPLAPDSNASTIIHGYEGSIDMPVSSNASDSADTTDTTPRSSNAILIQQLAASHAIWRELETRLASSEWRSRRRIRTLERELAQCRKSEGAVRAVFVQYHENVQELGPKLRALERKEAELQEREKRVAELEENVTERGEQALAKAEELDVLLAKQKATDDCDNHPGRVRSTYLLGCKNAKLFELASDFKRPKWFNNIKLTLLRRHDYYKGWLDCKRAFDTKHAVACGDLTPAETAYLDDSHDPRSPINAGLNAGFIFGWSAICQGQGHPNRDDRLDDRAWTAEDLVPKVQGADVAFWNSVEVGRKHVEKAFIKAREENAWILGHCSATYVRRASGRGGG